MNQHRSRHSVADEKIRTGRSRGRSVLQTTETAGREHIRITQGPASTFHSDVNGLTEPSPCPVPPCSRVRNHSVVNLVVPFPDLGRAPNCDRQPVTARG
jgi:hypothetical protein